MPREGVTRVAIPLQTVAVAIAPARIVIAVPAVLIRFLSLVSRTAPKRRRTIVIAVARPCSGLAPVVFTLAVVRAAAPCGAGLVGTPLVVALVVVARVKIHRRATLSVRSARQETGGKRPLKG